MLFTLVNKHQSVSGTYSGKSSSEQSDESGMMVEMDRSKEYSVAC